MSDTLEHVKEETSFVTTDEGDHDKFQHYFTKKAISDNLMTGKPMTAICGRVVKRQVDPQGRSVCDVCKDLYENVVQDG